MTPTEVGDLAPGTLFTTTDHPLDRDVWMVRRQVESYTYVHRPSNRAETETLVMDSLEVYPIPQNMPLGEPLRRAIHDGMCHQPEEDN